MVSPSVVLLIFPCFIGISAFSGPWSPDSPFVLFNPQDGPFYARKTQHFKWKMSASNAGKNAKRTHGSIFYKTEKKR